MQNKIRRRRPPRNHRPVRDRVKFGSSRTF